MKYFVELIPNSCFLCDCCHDIYSQQYCGIEYINVDKYFDHNAKPDWCPLRQLKSDFLEDKLMDKNIEMKGKIKHIKRIVPRIIPHGNYEVEVQPSLSEVTDKVNELIDIVNKFTEN